ncbi:bactofilin family protein [Enterobacter kobei]|uniref:bactofilin family protein n=1 Tax=Enterobacter kobei TaxID=208224 RepID=UPI003BEEEAC6
MASDKESDQGPDAGIHAHHAPGRQDNGGLPAGAQSETLRSGKPHHALWGVWLTWGLALVLWVSEGNGGLYRHATVTGIALALWMAGCGLLTVTLRRGKHDMQLLKKKTPDTEPAGVTPPAVLSDHASASGALRDVVVTAVRRDVFIAQGSHLSGQLEAEGNIVTEGSVEGNITATHQVRVDTGGVVTGDIRAAHIIINGLVTGRCYADAVSLLGQGRIEGDVFTGELSVERGGVFIGQSCLPEPGQVPKGQGKDRVEGVSRRDVLAMDAYLKDLPKEKKKEVLSEGVPPSETSGSAENKPEGQA